MVVVSAALAACGGGPPGTGEAQELLDAWARVEHGGADVRTVSGRELAAEGAGSTDIELRGVCERDDFDGDAMARQQSLTVSSTGAALETYLSGFDCETATALRVNGKEWVAVTKVDEVATAMVQTGGEMDLFGRLTRDMTSTAPAAFPG